MKRRVRWCCGDLVVGGRHQFVGGPGTTQADPVVARDAGVIVEWNEITERTLVENAQPIFQSLLYYGFTALAMYDAVVSIEGGYEPWTRLPRATLTPHPRWRQRQPPMACCATTSRTPRQR